MKICYKLEQHVLKIRAAFLLQIRAKFITNWGLYYKLEQVLIQIGAGIAHWRNVYNKLGQVLQIRAYFITYSGRY